MDTLGKSLRSLMARAQSAAGDVVETARQFPTAIAWTFAGICTAFAIAMAAIAYPPASTPTPETPAMHTIDEIVSVEHDAAETRRIDVGEAVKNAKRVVESSAETPKAAEPAPEPEPEPEPKPEPEPRFSMTDFSDTLCVGDGVMAFSSERLAEALPGATVDALRGRAFDHGGAQTSYDESSGVLDIVAADGGAHARYVVSTGTEEWAGLSVERLEELMSAVNGAELFVVAPYISNNDASTAATNESLRVVAEKHPNVHICDWRRWASEHRDKLRDNCHPDEEAAGAYASIVRDELAKAVV